MESCGMATRKRMQVKHDAKTEERKMSNGNVKRDRKEGEPCHVTPSNTFQQGGSASPPILCDRARERRGLGGCVRAAPALRRR